jgi:hypothetical protein
MHDAFWLLTLLVTALILIFNYFNLLFNIQDVPVNATSPIKVN